MRRSIPAYTPACGALLLALAGCLASAPPPKPLNPVRFLSVSDISTPETPADGGGIARLATVRQRIPDQGTVLLVVAGDFLGAPPAADGGRRMIAALSAAKVDYVTFGEDELRLDRDTLAARVAESKFKWISSNCGAASGGPLSPKVLRWDTVRVSTHKVGLFGLTMQGPQGPNIRCSDPDSAARRMIDTLSAQGADLIVALTHQPIGDDRDLLLRESKLDLVLGGHEPEAHDSVISTRHLLKADSGARSAQFATLWGGKGEWRQAVGLVPIDARVPPDTAVARVVNTNPG